MPAKQRKTTTWSLRLTPDQLVELKQRAKDADVSMSEYVLAAALEQPLPTSGVDERFKALESRVLELERAHK